MTYACKPAAIAAQKIHRFSSRYNRTRKFHDDETAHLEARLTRDEIGELKRRFASWPMAARLPSCGVVIAHGALTVGSRDDLERVRYQGALDDLREGHELRRLWNDYRPTTE